VVSGGAVRVRYLGWSGFLVESEAVRIAVDPHWSSWDPSPEPPWELPPLDLLLVSHGHRDHIGDVGRLMELHPGARLAAGRELIDWAEAEWPIAGRTDRLPDDGAVRLGDVEVTAWGGVHVGEGFGPQARAFAHYIRRRPRSALRLVKAAVLDRRPARIDSLLLRVDGRSILHASETLHRGTERRRWRRQVEGCAPDLLLLGVEPKEERAALAAGREVQAIRTCAFSPHLRTRRHFGMDPGATMVDWAAVEADGASRLWEGDEILLQDR
jgi:L-ascorbate metabolism protein UlaG (beta-lactamase superfamily)